MTMMRKKLSRWILLVIACVVIPGAVVFSQDATDQSDGTEDVQGIPPGPGGDPGTEVPFDGGVSLLVAAGVAYGAKKALDAKKKGTAAGMQEAI